MPIYEYVCRGCSRAFEHLARSASAPAPTCPACGATRPKKQFSVFSAAQSVPDACPTDIGQASSCREAGCSTGTCPYAGG